MRNDFPRMIYKEGGPHAFNQGMFDYLIVDDQEELDSALGRGWSMTVEGAMRPQREENPIIATPEPVLSAREEMEKQARELGIKFDGRTSNAKLAGKIAAIVKG